jgi:dATP pyrophosphohydrolase
MSNIVCRIVEVGVVTLRKGKPYYLLLRRSIKDRLYPNTWQIVTGTIEEYESALQASLRELREETGLIPERYWVVPHMNTFIDPRKDIVHHTAIFLAQVSPRKIPVLSSEHYQYKWCSLAMAKRYLVWPGQITAVEIMHKFIVRKKQTAALTELTLY